MAKNVIFCADGTWGGPESNDIDSVALKYSNVLKLFQSLAGAIPPLADEMERPAWYPNGALYQIAKYIHGVGDSKNPLVKFAGGSLGAGLLARLVRGYTFISRNYRPGDRIYVIGFSRGAYTARALAGLIAAQGLLNWDAMKLGGSGDTTAYAAAMDSWKQYKAKHNSVKAGILEKLASMVQEVEEAFYDAFGKPPLLQLVTDVPIKAVAVWDTVGALGIPEYARKENVRVDVFDFVDLDLNPQIELGFHAVSIDEMRIDFTPSLWTSRTEGGIEQVLYPGAHQDVGGGYSSTGNETGLSDGALQYMLDRLISAGVQFGMIVAHTPAADGVCHRPWLDPVYYGRTAARCFPSGMSLSQSAVDRVARGVVPIEMTADALYRPANLSKSYFLADWAGVAANVKVVAI